MKLMVSTSSKIGNRSVNEDYVTYREEDGKLILVVADGLGGHDKGEVASEYVGNYIREEFQFDGRTDTELKKVIVKAQNALLEMQQSERAVAAMKTTVVSLVIHGESAFFAHVGDSRGYVFQKRKKYSRTIDHSVPQMLALAGEIKEKEIRKHPERSSLLRVLGSVWEKEAVELSDEIKLNKTKAFLLCSDGFWELIEEKSMIRCLKQSKTPKEWLCRMEEIIEKNGKGTEMDNYTAGAVFVMEEK